MSPIRIRILTAATLAALFSAAHAAPGQDVNLDGSAHKNATLSATANRQLAQDSVPSVKTDPQSGPSIAAQADAEMAARDARRTGPKLVVQRQNLKENQAARAIEQQTTPNTIDHDVAYGDKDHTEQLTNLKLSLKK